MKSAIFMTCLLIFAPDAANAALDGERAPAFQLADTNGAIVTLDSLLGKVVLLNFWATWCLPCREELPEFDRLYQKYRDSGLVVIGISVDTSGERVATFMKKRPVGFPVVTDTQGAVAEAYRFSGLPAAFLIGRDGVIVRRYRGSGKEMISLYEKDIEDLLKRD
ncbi:MAG: TlpA family protein disulfide reductase [Nitrospirae bacterium]|nr:TlpA family protein disulfide reductase [Nitrospirota bacterium]